MGHTVSPAAAGVPLERFADLRPTMAKVDLRSPDDWRSMQGAAIAEAIRSVGWSYKEAAAAIGLRNQAQLARWIHGTENPQFSSVVERRRAARTARHRPCEAERRMRGHHPHCDRAAEGIVIDLFAAPQIAVLIIGTAVILWAWRIAAGGPRGGAR